MRKEGYRLPSARQDYNADAEATVCNEVSTTVGRLLPIKTYRDMSKECVDTAAAILDMQVLADQDDARTRHNARQLELQTAANTVINAWNNGGAQGQQPQPHILEQFVATAPLAADYAARLSILRNETTIACVLSSLSTGLAMKELYEDAPTKTASEKLTAGHIAALQAAAADMHHMTQRLPLTQAYGVLLSLLTKTIVASWKTDVQGYTAAHLASAVVKANQATLATSITIAAAYDGVRAHCDAFAGIYPAESLGYAQLLSESVLKACEPPLLQHLRATVAEQKRTKWASLTVSEFAERIAEQAQLVATRLGPHPQVAALELQIAGLRTEQGRLELRLQEQTQRRDQQHRNRGQRAPRGQVVGSPDYSGCNFRLPGGARCGNLEHVRRDHPQ